MIKLLKTELQMLHLLARGFAPLTSGAFLDEAIRPAITRVELHPGFGAPGDASWRCCQ